ncbi:hypothetical protein AB0J38_25785 [Streptomyces sp. NPDC050095]|uniref:hypothetical protein n=1 Tax=unclassified Streptomyces TaxID=2593676 RepID=UPI00343AD790
MGYRPKRRIYDLQFEDPEMDGLEVKVRHVNTGDALALDAAVEAGTEEGLRKCLTLLAESLVSWNVEGDDGPVPATLDGVMAQELDFNIAIVNAWRTALVGVPAPLDSASPDGVPSLEASIPMDVPSESQAS